MIYKVWVTSLQVQILRTRKIQIIGNPTLKAGIQTLAHLLLNTLPNDPAKVHVNNLPNIQVHKYLMIQRTIDSW